MSSSLHQSIPHCNAVPGKTRSSAVVKIRRKPIRVNLRLVPLLGYEKNPSEPMCFAFGETQIHSYKPIARLRGKTNYCMTDLCAGGGISHQLQNKKL